MWDKKRQHFVGSYADEVEAARAYDHAVLRKKGDDARGRARMNFPVSDYNLQDILAESCWEAAATAQVSLQAATYL